MSNVRNRGTKSSLSWTPKRKSGVLAGRVVTVPLRLRDDPTQTSQTPEMTADSSTNTEQENGLDVVANERFIEDSQFLLQASLFLQTAEQQLNNIESSLKKPKFPRKIFSLNIDNCDKREYAHRVVEAVLSGHDLKQEENFTVPARFLKNISKKVKPFLQDKNKSACAINDGKDGKIKPLKKITNVSGNSDTSFKNYRKQEFGTYSNSIVDLSQTYKKSSLTCNIPSHDNVSTNTVTEKVNENFIVDKPLTHTRETVPCDIVTKKTTIVSTPVPNNNNQMRSSSKNAALINVLSNRSSIDENQEDDTCPKTKLIRNSLIMQALPSINIKPELTQETFTQVNILPSKTQQKEASNNKNVAFIEIVFDEKDKEKKVKTEKSPRTQKYDNSELVRRRPHENAGRTLRITEPSVSFSTEPSTDSEHRKNCHQESSFLRKQKQSFDRGKLNNILNDITEKLASYVEIPDEILENTIDRLWILGDYLEDVYVNSVEGYRQKVRLNFTSLWLHEIIRLIDNEMKNKGRSLNLSSGVTTIVQYIISEIQCSSAVSHQQYCILAEENGEIQFYCSHNSNSDRVHKSKKENRAAMFLKSLSPSKITSSRPSSSMPKKNTDIIPHRTSKSIIKKERHLTNENAKSSSIDSRLFNENEITFENSPKLSNNERRFKDFESTETRRLDSFVPEKLVPTRIKDVNLKKENAASKNPIFYGKNKYMDADQRQKVIQKLGEEVQKMLSWHEKLQLPDHFDESIESNRSVSQTDRSEIKTAPSSKKSSPVSATSSEIEADKAMRKTKAEIDFKENSHETRRELNPRLDSVQSVTKPNQTEGVSSVNSSEDVAYEDDWEEDCNTSAKNDENRQQIVEVENQNYSNSALEKASKFLPAEIKCDDQNKADVLIDTATKRNGDTSIVDHKNFLINPVENNVANTASSNTSKKESVVSKASRITSEEQSIHDSPKVKESMENDRFYNNIPVENQLSKNISANLAPGSETDIASDFSDREGSTVNTESDKARNSNSDIKQSRVDSEAETVKDFSLINSEVVDSGSKISLSLHFRENSFKENDSGVVGKCSASEHDSLFSNESSGINESKTANSIVVSREGCLDETKNNFVDKLSSENPSISSKLSKSCQELAEKVINIEQMKNDLLRMLVKPENESVKKLSSSQSLPGLKRKIEETNDISSNTELNPNNSRNVNENELDFGSPTFSVPEFATEEMLMESKNPSISVLPRNEGKNSDQYCDASAVLNKESSIHNSQIHGFVVENPTAVDCVSSDSLSKSSISLSSVEVTPDSELQRVFGIKSVSEESLFSQPACERTKRETVFKESVRKSENCQSLLLPRHEKTNENNAVKSFVELSSEILKHLKQESELLAQLDSASSVLGTLSEISGGDVKGETSSGNGDILEKKFHSDRGSSSQSELETDLINHAIMNSDFSPPDFEHLMSELSENIRGSIDSSEDFSCDSVDEIFSMVSSERFKVDCSKNLEASIKDLFCSDDTHSDFVVERF